MNADKASANFWFAEFAVSESRPDLAAKIVLTQDDKDKIVRLCENILQPVRDEFGPVRITSGKRSPELLAAIRGASKTSDHLFEKDHAAADFVVTGVRCEVVAKWVYDNVPHGAIGQLIFYPEQNFCHVSLPRFGGHKSKFLVHRGAKYEQWPEAMLRKV